MGTHESIVRFAKGKEETTMKRMPPPLGVSMVQFLSASLPASTIIGAILGGVVGITMTSITPFPILFDIILVALGTCVGGGIATPIRGLSTIEWGLMMLRTITTKPTVHPAVWGISARPVRPLTMVQTLLQSNASARGEQ